MINPAFCRRAEHAAGERRESLRTRFERWKQQPTGEGLQIAARARWRPLSPVELRGESMAREESMEMDELVASLRRDSQGVNRHMSDLDAHLGEQIGHTNTRIDDLGTRLGERIGDTNKRIDDLATHLGERLDDTNVRLDRVDKRFDELAAYLRTFEQRMFDHLQSVQTELGRRIDAVAPFRLQGLALVVALTATSAIVGTFALQLLAVL